MFSLCLLRVGVEFTLAAHLAASVRVSCNNRAGAGEGACDGMIPLGQGHVFICWLASVKGANS
jgi:hypothetical protein